MNWACGQVGVFSGPRRGNEGTWGPKLGSEFRVDGPSSLGGGRVK